MPAVRFVILHHCQPGGEHWDLMIEQPRMLSTWRLSRNPLDHPGETIPARRIGDHRKAYLDYEGPVSDDRGKVHRVDGGTYQLLRQTDDVWEIAIAGAFLSGTATLQKDPPDSATWQLSVPFLTPGSRL